MRFEPKGAKPLWEMIYDEVVNLEPETIITFKKLSEAIGENFVPQRSVIYKTRKELAKNKKRFLVSIRGTGYKVVEGNEQLLHAESHHDRAQVQVKLANFEALNINTKVMSPEEKSRWSQFLAWNGTVMTSLSHNAEQIAKAGIVAHIATDSVLEQLKTLKGQMDQYNNQIKGLEDSLNK